MGRDFIGIAAHLSDLDNLYRSPSTRPLRPQSRLGQDVEARRLMGLPWVGATMIGYPVRVASDEAGHLQQCLGQLRPASMHAARHLLGIMDVPATVVAGRSGTIRVARLFDGWQQPLFYLLWWTSGELEETHMASRHLLVRHARLDGEFLWHVTTFLLDMWRVKFLGPVGPERIVETVDARRCRCGAAVSALAYWGN